MTAPFHLMAKPVGPRCNLACRYCFYLDKAAQLPAGTPARMTEDVLRAYIRQVAAAADGPVVLAFQGGEPTLAGLEFYRRAAAIAQEMVPAREIQWVLQTNGVLLDDEWCRFLAEHRFLVGLSLDGPAWAHDAKRRTRSGEATHAEVVRALRRLQAHGVEFNVLTTVHAVNARRPLEVYRHLRELGVRYIQFIPIVERVADEAERAAGLAMGRPGAAPAGHARRTDWSVRPKDYGHFLVEVFDEWLRRDTERITLQIVESALAARLGTGATVCQFAPECGRSLIVETNGDVYACDHYVWPEYWRGNLLDTPLAEIVDSPEQMRFGREKAQRLPWTCRTCEVLALCGGDCPKHRWLAAPDEPDRPRSVLCEAYRRFFNHAWPWLEHMAAEIRAGPPRVAAPAPSRGPPPAARNSPCPCGSSRKYKHCCGRRAR